MPELRDCIVVHGPDLLPHHCRRFAWQHDTITALELGAPCNQLDSGALVVIPGLYNGHTHIGDCALPDGATGLTLEEAFFRPAGYKYRELAKLAPADHLPHLVAHQRYMARTGTIAHFDFREQGAAGARLLREASAITGVQSIILNQFDSPPFSAADLEANTAALPAAARDELAAMLAVADGFSESTMNDLTDPAWRELRSLTTSPRKLRAIHCLESVAYRDRSLALTGRGDLLRAIEDYDADLIVHLTVATDDEVALLARTRKTAALNPRANATLGLPLPPVAALLRANVNLLLGTDNVMLNAPSLLAELDFAYKLARSQSADAATPDPARILKMVTSNIRPLLGGDHYGYLDVHLPADFVIFDFHAPHLRCTRHLLASLVTRVTPADILATHRQGRPLWSAPSWP